MLVLALKMKSLYQAPRLQFKVDDQSVMPKAQEETTEVASEVKDEKLSTETIG